MTATLATALIAHVILGVTAIALINLTLMHLVRRAPSFLYLSVVSFMAFALFLISWASGAYYYVVHYGKSVKPIIVAGKYPWAHAFFMEAKEHVFLFIPFLAFLLWLVVNLLRRVQDPKLKRAAAVLALVALLIGVFVAGAGIFVSGAVRT